MGDLETPLDEQAKDQAMPKGNTFQKTEQIGRRSELSLTYRSWALETPKETKMTAPNSLGDREVPILH